MKHILTFSLVVWSLAATAQTGWKWPENEKLFKEAQEKQAYYKVLMGQDKYAEALSVLKWLYTNNAELNPSIYIDGTKCAEEAMKGVTDPVRLGQLQDTALWMYDMRIKFWGNETSVMDRKAYAAFKYHYKTQKKYPDLIATYARTFQLNGTSISTFNLLPYMTIAKYGYEWKLKEMTGDNVLEIHSLLSNIMDEKEKAGEDMVDTSNKIDALLSSIEGLLTCEYIVKNLVPRLKANPNDIGTAKKIFVYSLQAKCSDAPYFLEAAEVVVLNQPEYKLLKVLGDKYLGSSEFSKAIEFYSKALPLATTAEEKYEVLLSLARAHGRIGQKSKARSFAYDALSAKPGEKEPYNLIGSLYAQSFEDCKGGVSKVMDRAIFIAAYEMFQKAGNSAQMEAMKAQFPSVEEMFTENMSEGDQVTVGCWISEKVTLKRR